MGFTSESPLYSKERSEKLVPEFPHNPWTTMSQIICHVGFPKTGTTFLQKNVFPNVQGVKFSPLSLTEVGFKALINEDDSVFDLESTRSLLAPPPPAGESILLSDERLMGSHLYSHFVNRSQIAHRLKAIGVAKIILSIRNQFSALESAYKQYVSTGGVIPYQRFFGFSGGFENAPFSLKYFDYSLAYSLFARLFGADNVLVLQHEHIRTADFYNQLSDFLSMEVQAPNQQILEEKTNRSLSINKTKWLRVINHFTYNNHRPSHLVSKQISTNIARRVLLKLPDLIPPKNLFLSF